ncbi:superoxide dismutase family protein [Palleronia sp. LCG004]|uniref:superoxide dismutase family protein n=1 Tax=Palleronia sp. LCG004 TaxID=3079304 RepID=UPI002941FD29|nr:superoxide dismutase family protein [Palleronia sp. LCG004]WOI57496.1 superoxide dismutase family protein [Palleronia sp. LCG004]
MQLRADVMNSEGTSIGTVTVNDTASGQALIVVALSDLPEGSHGIHLHETGDCSADDFSSAGGHISGDREHGILAAGGPHPGDLPNVVVGSDGNVNVEIFNDLIDIEGMLLDDNGAAFIVHSEPDDYSSQPSGDAGDRIACGVLEEV